MDLWHVAAITLVPNDLLMANQLDGERAIPSRIDIASDGRAIAWYGEAPLLWYHSLDELLTSLELSRDEFVAPPVVDDGSAPKSGPVRVRVLVGTNVA